MTLVPLRPREQGNTGPVKRVAGGRSNSETGDGRETLPTLCGRMTSTHVKNSRRTSTT